MFERIVEEITGGNLVDSLSEFLSIDKKEATTLISKLSFSDYTDMKTALMNTDANAVNSIISKYKISEVNAYSVANQSSQPNGGANGEEQIPDFTQLGVGDSVKTDKGTVAINRANTTGSQTTYGTSGGQSIMVSDKPVVPSVGPTNKEDALQQIKDLQKLAGIETDEIGENIGSPTPMSCKAMSRDGSTTPNQIIKRHRKRLKPGPKTGKA